MGDEDPNGRVTVDHVDHVRGSSVWREISDDLGGIRGGSRNLLLNPPPCPDRAISRARRRVYDHANLRVIVTPPEHLLAMKIRAARAVRDTDDLRLLLAAIGITTMDQAVEIVDRYFPDEPLGDRSRQLLEDLLDDR